MPFLMIFRTYVLQTSLLGMALALVACRAPKPAVPEKPPVPAPAEVKPPEPVLPAGGPVPLPNDGIRMGNMLELPSDNEFRSTNPNLTKPTTNPGPVIARPPTDPPSRVTPPAPQKPE